ncbi:MAG: glycosyl transferase family protein [Acidobacteria bacterium]|nr:glycosyl transferase family protein [Acidobacteriota bacterium]
MPPEAATLTAQALASPWGALQAADSLLLAVLPVLAFWLLLSGIDDLSVDLLALWHRAQPVPPPPGVPRNEQRLAIFIPCWQESAVIAQMLAHNTQALLYRNYIVFAGAYPNDPETLEAVQEEARQDERIRLCVVPHDGPTSKADCLNWLFQHLLLEEESSGQRFRAVITHDAEDLIDPASLNAVNRYIGAYDMVQIPVLPLPTAPGELTHGIYCDEFAESQGKDLAARVAAGGFLPSCGVGTAFSRRALELLARSESNRVFDPGCLTEDYQIGYRIHQLGLPQIFLEAGPDLVATREFFPQSLSSAIRQRTRWISGIALQGWQRNGWGRTWRERYWFWRDRKGLLGNPLSLLANLIFAYGAITFTIAQHAGRPWGLGQGVPVLVWPGIVFQVVRLVTRAVWTAKVYGWGFALLTPLRAVWANLINTAATVSATFRFGRSVFTGVPLVWLKTDHSFPSPEALRNALPATAATVAAAPVPRARVVSRS